MVKVSITLPNAAQITLESEESEVIQQVVSMALRDLPRELMQSSPDSNPGNGQANTPQVNGRAATQNRTSVVEVAGAAVVERTGTSGGDPVGISGEIPTPENPASGASRLASGSAAATPGETRTNRNATPRPTQTRRETPAVRQSGNQAAEAAPTSAQAPARVATREADNRFARFCAAAAPLGDMRKVVVAAEGANRFLGMHSVDATDLAGLFELAGWRIPHNFIQTLRNAARDKYRWLERVPGRSGRYTATDLGRTVTLGA